MAQKVLVYSTPTCPFCRMAKQLFQENGIAFTNFDVSVDAKAAQEMVNKTHQLGVPVIDIDGKIIIGFDETEIRQTLGLPATVA